MTITRRDVLRLGTLGTAGAVVGRWPGSMARASTPRPAPAGAAPPASARGRQWEPLVLAFYYPWYGGPPRWRHWSDCGHHPDRFVAGPTGPNQTGGAGGVRRRDIEATDYPVRGPYDSLDPATIERHCHQLVAAGVDGLITSWWGPGTYEDRAVALELSAALGHGLRVSAYFEIAQIYPGGDTGAPLDPTTYTERAAKMAETIDRLVYLLDRYGSHPGWLRARRPGGLSEVPVVFVYQATFFSASEWMRILARVRSRAGDAFFSADTSGGDPQHVFAFDGIHTYTLTYLTRDGAVAVAAGDPVQYASHGAIDVNPASADLPGQRPWNQAEVGNDERALAAWARAHGRHWAATVMPGFDDRSQRAACRPDSFYTARRGGDFYRQSWQLALSTRPDWVLLTSFNEWHEGSEIEPSVEYGDAYIRSTHRLGSGFRRR